jgi:hypothetical protein
MTINSGSTSPSRVLSLIIVLYVTTKQEDYSLQLEISVSGLVQILY